MSFSRISSFGVYLNNITMYRSSGGKAARLWRTGFAILLPLFLTLLVSCTNPFASNSGGSGPTSTAAPTAPSLADLHWCGKASMLFRDEGARSSPTPTTSATVTATPSATARPSGGSPTAASATPLTSTVGPGTPTTLTSWDEVKADLTFTVFLPASLPAGTCLVSAQATVHDPILGGNFLIGYLLPDHTALTISEAPLISQNTTFQCNVSGGSAQKPPTASGTPGAGHATPSPTPLPLQLCSGAKDTTNIVLSAQQSVEYLQKLFTALQPGVTWIPKA